MLINIIWALHFGQAGRSNGADGKADDRRSAWVMVLPLQTGGSTTLSVAGIALGTARRRKVVYAAGSFIRESIRAPSHRKKE